MKNLFHQAVLSAVLVSSLVAASVAAGRLIGPPREEAELASTVDRMTLIGEVMRERLQRLDAARPLTSQQIAAELEASTREADAILQRDCYNNN